MSESQSDVGPEEVDAWFVEEDEPSLEAEDPSSNTPTDPAKKYAVSQLRVVRETKDYQLDYLQHALQPGRELIDISPAYQRRLRWPNKKKSLLIESFLLNIPVPPIFLFERDYNEYEVIDGRQRLDSISSFLNNDYALTGLEYWQELNRKRFLDLPQVLQKGLLRRSLPAVVLLAETSETSGGEIDVRRVLFDRLNTGGIRLNPQELRNALYPGRLNALLIELARSDLFTEIWGIPPYQPKEEINPSDQLLDNPLFSSLADAELVLRFFALRDAIRNNRSGSLRLILDRYMEKNAHPDVATAQAMSADFTNSLVRLRNLFGSSTFKLPSTGRTSRPLYDALMVALSCDPSIDIETNASAVQQALARALSDPESYDVLVGRGNTIGAVRQRVDLAEHILRTR
ncbi:DUF262 domain-containing protein [Kocuria rhizophila]|uniref:DUF262 domain-containing protein n=1 Tax=Kocuria rhizophila TaxID=72000 RepID=UPI0011A4BF7A|nr:DUF262 domain-containing protein [Kocuria rhizophila]